MTVNAVFLILDIFISRTYSMMQCSITNDVRHYIYYKTYEKHPEHHSQGLKKINAAI